MTRPGVSDQRPAARAVASAGSSTTLPLRRPIHSSSPAPPPPAPRPLHEHRSRVQTGPGRRAGREIRGQLPRRQEGPAGVPRHPGRGARQGELLRGDRLAADQGRPADAEAARRLRPRPPRSAGRIHYRLKDLIKCMPADGHPMDALHASVAALGHVLPVPDGHRPGEELGRDAAADRRDADAGRRVRPHRAAARRSSTRAPTSTTPATSTTCSSARSRPRPSARCSTRA